MALSLENNYKTVKETVDSEKKVEAAIYLLTDPKTPEKVVVSAHVFKVMLGQLSMKLMTLESQKEKLIDRIHEAKTQPDLYEILQRTLEFKTINDLYHSKVDLKDFLNLGEFIPYGTKGKD